MSEEIVGLPIDLEAARAVIEWKDRFTVELHGAAQRLAVGSERVTIEHYRAGLAAAAAAVVQGASRPSV